ncbi:MAG: arsenic transporter [Clostridiales bacterium]|nr:arsenic transporter [Clostridiales bacterium]
MNLQLIALILFIVMYAGMIAFTKYRPWIALGAAAVFLILGVQPVAGVPAAIDWNVLMMLAGTMGTVALFIESKMPNRMADGLLRLTPTVMGAAVVLSLFSGFVSAFIDNVATVLMIAPVGLAIAKKLKISPVPLLISISVSSNLQGAATLVGDTTSIMLGGYAGMDFLDFFFMQGKPSIFWAVELGAVATVPVILFIFRRNREKIEPTPLTEVTDYFPSVLLVLNVALLIAASFIPNKPAVTNGLICIALCAVGLIRTLIRDRKMQGVKTALSGIDFETLLLLAGLFIVISGITEVGIIEEISKLFVKIGGNSLFLMYTLIVFGSVLFSAFIDNIPYVATMLPVVQGIAGLMGCNPLLLYFGLLCGATLGGNLTPIGASANIVTIGMLRKNGFEVKTSDFMKIGFPFTMVAVLTGYLFCWFVWA